MMTQQQILEEAWKACIARVVAMVDDYSADWTPNGPSKAAAERIRNKIKAMPCPVKREAAQ